MAMCIHQDKNHFLQLVMFFLGHCKRLFLGILFLDVVFNACIYQIRRLTLKWSEVPNVCPSSNLAFSILIHPCCIFRLK